ncbi:ABC transporter ATP-binding protein [Massilia cavernae]|uniref:ABC transporter ATP-binding protein n=1 Tax=Massilia cavernae TaxID=2320864 RepID=A0A418XW41_9BURK|nr:ABC transporter ATP-binding protein [Massilia cavernae]RJG16998.1 ABC transporter ATP-binding protein [Massilia cavernae]
MEAILNKVPALAPELVNLGGVHKHYGQGLAACHALHDIHLKLAPAEMIAVCGPSGSGKTSLLNIIGMLDSATEGSVIIARLLVSKMSDQGRADLRNELIGFVFQSSSLIPVMTAHENVLLPLMLRGRLDETALEETEQRAADLLSRLGLATQMRQYPGRLDASQCQRVAIARALVTLPRLVVADEPTSRLDNGCIRLVMDLFARYQHEHGTAFVLSTRDQRQFSRVSRTLQLNEGRLASTPTEARRRPLRVQG